MEVLVNNRQKKIKLNKARIRKIAIEIMKFQDLSDNTELSLVFCDDDFIQKLNEEYLGRNQPTDVIAFPMEEENFDPDVHLLGDVVISTETASHQAQKLKHSVGLEIIFLLIHGILHLTGFDHKKNKSDLLRMKDREESLFKILNEKKLLKGIELIKNAPLISRTIPKTAKKT